MVADNELDRRVFADQARLLERERNMSKAGIEPKGYGMRKLHENRYD